MDYEEAPRLPGRCHRFLPVQRLGHIEQDQFSGVGGTGIRDEDYGRAALELNDLMRDAGPAFRSRAGARLPWSWRSVRRRPSTRRSAAPQTTATSRVQAFVIGFAELVADLENEQVKR